MPGYSIGQVAEVTKLTERQIRYCEEREYIKPLRSPGGHRLFSERDLTLLTLLAEQRRQGKSLKKAMAAVNRPSGVQHRKNEGQNMAVRLFFGLSDKEKRL